MGNDVALGEFPWQVSLKLGPNHFCSGTIVSDFWVMSSAQCLTSKNTTLIMEVGVINLSISGRVYSISKVVPHTEYNTETSDNNIALLKTTDRITFNDLVQPACFPEDHLLDFDELKNCRVTGWRKKKKDSSNIETVLQKLSIVPIVPCYVKNMPDVMCANVGEVPGSSDCTVDSGDSLVCQYWGNNAWTLCGVVSMAVSTCEDTIIFARTARYITWMKEVTAMEGKPLIPEIPEMNEQQQVAILKEEEVTSLVNIKEIPRVENRSFIQINRDKSITTSVGVDCGAVTSLVCFLAIHPIFWI
ncbi:chymotrypsinogen B-like isoform X2 [Ascaphus truei]|uniref:chymotrypsinogen B-like isoform X2 n=1 Tax=Ascaphus truei TaxID=8439 RepID=UPI003F59F4E7